jgi:hypothetical protein
VNAEKNKIIPDGEYAHIFRRLEEQYFRDVAALEAKYTATIEAIRAELNAALANTAARAYTVAQEATSGTVASIDSKLDAMNTRITSSETTPTVARGTPAVFMAMAPGTVDINSVTFTLTPGFTFPGGTSLRFSRAVGTTPQSYEVGYI